MENSLLRQIVVVTSPSLLPPEDDHATSIASLCLEYQFVVLLHFGDEQYELPRNYCLPFNARVVYYDYETLDESLEEIEDCLAGFGVGLISRHHNGKSLPFVLGGSILQVPTNVQLSFLDEHTDVPDLVKVTVDIPDAEWDL